MPPPGPDSDGAAGADSAFGGRVEDLRCDRRQLLAFGAAGLLAAGCTGSRPDRSTPAARNAAGPAALRRDASLRGAAQADERTLITLYERAAEDNPPLAATLRVFAGHHREHLDVLADPTASPRPGDPSATGATPSGANRSGSSAPAGRDAALATLAAAEQAAAHRRGQDCAATEGALATLLASVGAAESTHAGLLNDLRARG